MNLEISYYIVRINIITLVIKYLLQGITLVHTSDWVVGVRTRTIDHGPFKEFLRVYQTLGLFHNLSLIPD